MVTVKKAYYSIREVCVMTGLEPHVLRYWESEFSQLRPKKNRSGNRAYREKDINIINYIKFLLYDEKFTIPGAKKKLAETKEFSPEQIKSEPESKPAAQVDSIESIRSELSEILHILK